MAVDHGQPVLVILCCHLSGRIGAEGSDLIIKGGRVVDQLGFIQILIQEIHDLIPDLHAAADIYRANLGLNPMVLANV